jgi:hypothetical protein
LQKHFLALGYFFLRVFCIFTSAHCFKIFSPILMGAAFLALVAGVGYIAEPFVVMLRAAGGWMVEVVRFADETPKQMSEKTEEKTNRLA